MRITNGMLTNNMLSNLNSNLNRMERYQNQGATGRKFDKPSDDPIGMSRSLKLYTDISKVTQYERNLNDANSWMHTTEEALGEIEQIIQRTRELTAGAANGTNAETDTQAIAEEIKQLKEQVIQLGNARHAGRSIFTGFKTDKDLLKSDGSYNIDIKKGDVSNYNVGISEDIDVNIVGSRVFGVVSATDDLSKEFDPQQAIEGDKSSMLSVFDNIIAAMNKGDHQQIDQQLKDIDVVHQNIISIKAEIGAKTNRLDMTEKRLSSEKLNFETNLSQNEDVDYADLIMKTKIAETVYQASLSISGRIIQPTLMDFLR